YAWTQAPSLSSMSCAIRCASSQSPPASCHSARSSGATFGGVSAVSVALNSSSVTADSASTLLRDQREHADGVRLVGRCGAHRDLLARVICEEFRVGDEQDAPVRRDQNHALRHPFRMSDARATTQALDDALLVAGFQMRRPAAFV